MKRKKNFTKCFLIIFYVFALETNLSINRAEALPFTTGASQAEGRRNEYALLRHFWPIVKQSKKGGRIDYASTCQMSENYPIPFPQISGNSPSKGAFGVNAVRQMFVNNKNIKVNQENLGVIKIEIGSVPNSILQTKISNINLEPIEQYNPSLAFSAIKDSVEVRKLMSNLNIRPSSRVINEILISPDVHLPHLPNSINNMTVGEALDLIAQTFDGIVVYGSCANSNTFTIDFIGGAGFDESKLQ